MRFEHYWKTDFVAFLSTGFVYVYFGVCMQAGQNYAAGFGLSHFDVVLGLFWTGLGLALHGRLLRHFYYSILACCFWLFMQG